jgi:hypothetical protein
LQNNRDEEIKEKALDTMFANQMNNLRHALLFWRNFNQQKAMEDAMNAEKKAFVVERLNNFAKNNTSEKLKVILRKFKDNANRRSVLFRIFQQIQSTTAGEVIRTFNKWKTIPESASNSDYAHAAKFERKLILLAHNQLVSTFSFFRDIHYDALAIKKRTALLIFKTQQTETQQALTQWRHNKDIINEGRKCKLLINFFDQLNNLTADNTRNLIADADSQKKEKALERIFSNYYHNLGSAFLIWKNLTKIPERNEELNPF